MKQAIVFVGALKEPRITDVASRIADQTRDTGWWLEDYRDAIV